MFSKKNKNHASSNYEELIATVEITKDVTIPTEEYERLIRSDVTIGIVRRFLTALKNDAALAEDYKYYTDKVITAIVRFSEDIPMKKPEAPAGNEENAGGNTEAKGC